MDVQAAEAAKRNLNQARQQAREQAEQAREASEREAAAEAVEQRENVERESAEARVVSETLDHMNEDSSGDTDSDYEFQETVLSGIYSGKGTIMDTLI